MSDTHLEPRHLHDRYGVDASDEDTRRLAQAVRLIFAKVEDEFGRQAGYVPADAMWTAIETHLAKAERLLGRARFAAILIDTMPTAWAPTLKASFVYVLAPRLKEVVEAVSSLSPKAAKEWHS